MCGITGIYGFSKEKIPNLDLKLNFFNEIIYDSIYKQRSFININEFKKLT